jgi:hypothetical protein
MKPSFSSAGIAPSFANIAIFNFIWRQNTALGDFFGDNILKLFHLHIS